MSKELIAAVKSLKRPQLISLLKQVKPFLSLATAGKSREALIDAALELHGKSKPNKFYGKELFGFTDAAHIKIPKRATKDETASQTKASALKSKERKLKKNQAELKKLREELKAVPKGDLEGLKKLQAKMKKLDAEIDKAMN